MVSTWSSFSGERNWKASSQNRNQPSLIISYLGDQDYSQDLANAPPTANLSSCKVRACEQGEQWQQALDLFVAEQSVELFPDVITCNVSSVLARKGDVRRRNQSGGVLDSFGPCLGQSRESR